MIKTKVFGKSLLSGVLALSMAACGAVAAAADETAADENYSYIMMNIPYSEFFAGEYEGGEQIDAVSSATMNKPGVSGLTAFSYHTEDLSQILGVAYPVAVPEDVTLDASLEVADTDALYEAGDYSYVVLTEAPSFYKVLTDTDGSYSFGESVGEPVVQEYESVELKSESHWSEYEIDFDQSLSELTVYAALMKTEQGNSYGLRVLENVWRGFEIGFTTDSDFQDPHGSALLTEPYADLPGQTVKEIILYTTDGLKQLDVDLYIPYQFDHTIEVAEASVKDGTAAVTLTGFPEDYDAEFAVEGNSDDIACDGENVTWTNALAGTYTMTVSDKSGKYSTYTQDFVLSTDETIAVADDANECLVAAEGVSEEQFAAYIANISSYTVGENEVSAGGHGGAILIKEDGTVDKTQNKVFSEVGEYEVVVHASGYNDVTLKVNITEVAESSEGEGGQGGHSGHGAH